MKIVRGALCALAFGMMLMFAGCAAKEMRPQETSVPDSPKLHIAVSILPQQYFVQRVGGDHVTVTVLVPPGGNPHTYEPKPEQLRALSTADAYLRIRVSFEDAWMERISAANPHMRIVDTTEGIQRMPLAEPDEHKKEGAHDHSAEEENLDPHIWLSPKLVKQQAHTIHNVLVELDPDHRAEYDQNLQRFTDDIDRLIQEIEGTLASVKQRKFMVFHPSWGYFARDFGLEMIAIEVGGQEPSAAELATIIRKAKEENIRVIFAQPEFSTVAAQTIANEIGGEVVLISPLAPDWLDNMRRVAAAFAKALQ